MPTLAEQVTLPPKRPQGVRDLVQMVDQEVDAKGGLSGLGIKAAFAAVKAIKPGFVPDVVDMLLDEWVAKLEPIYAQAVAAAGPGAPVTQKLMAQSPAVADALLSVTDERARRTSHATARKFYEKLRPSAKRNVEEAVPRLAALLDKHTRA